MSFQDPDHQQRKSAAAAAKQAMLQKFRAASEDPEVARRHAARVAMNEARLVRMAEREAEEAEALLAAEEAKRAILLEAEQKAARDARYAARKAAKKERRRGY